MNISPKAIAALIVPVVAAALLWLITGNDTYLIGILLGFVSGGSAALAPPAVGVKQSQVQALVPSATPEQIRAAAIERAEQKARTRR